MDKIANFEIKPQTNIGLDNSYYSPYASPIILTLGMLTANLN